MRGINGSIKGSNEADKHAVISRSRPKGAGSLTLESALVLPVILCAFFIVIFLIKTVFTYEIVQHALDETAAEIASMGYLYHISGIRDIHDQARNSLNDRVKIIGDQISDILGAYDSLRGLANGLSNDTLIDRKAWGLVQDARENIERAGEVAGDALLNPLDELKSIICYILKDGLNEAKTQLFIPVVKLYMKKYLVSEACSDLNKRLRLLNIVDGLDGMDFSDSSFLEDRNEDIDIVVKYKISLPLPVHFTTGCQIVQRVKVKVWMGGDETKGVLTGNSLEEDLWSLGNFERGRKIQRLFDANLPSNFPVIAKYSNGRATMIKSMDLTAVSYQKGNTAKNTLMGYLNTIAAYKGQDKPWGSSGITIKTSEITCRELLLIIPGNQLSDEIEKVLVEIAEAAKSKGVVLTVKKYGVKAVE